MQHEPNEPTDLLLINGSNFPGQAIFPYAFVQVSALARHYGLTVRRLELLPYQFGRWPYEIANAIKLHQPRMVGTHLRQADSQYLPGYVRTPENDDPLRTYFPVENTRWIIDAVRHLTDAPTIVGGFGFTAQAPRLIEHLQPDFGVVGEADALFGSFERVLAAKKGESLSDVPNLVWRDAAGYRVNERCFFDPLDAAEYSEEIFSELVAFYGAMGRSVSIGDFAEADVPVEAMRGCPCSCYFCTEPTVKGRRVRHRNLDAIMEDVEFLGARNVHSIFFISSEINMGGMDFPLMLAERMLRFNERRKGREVHWKAYAMPRPGMSRDDMKTMMRAGYFPGWNEFASFDDRNLKKCKMPYRTEHVVRYFRDMLELAEDPTLYSGPPLLKFEMFLGNAFIDAEAIRTTLRVIDEQGFAQRHTYSDVITGTRVYERDGKPNCGTPETIFSVNIAGRQAYDPVWPSFHYAPELLRELGGEEEVETFLKFVSNTFLCTSYRSRQSATHFVLGHVDLGVLASLLSEATAGKVCAAMMSARVDEANDAYDAIVMNRALAQAEEVWAQPSVQRLRALVAPHAADARIAETSLALIVRVLFKLNAQAFEHTVSFLALPLPSTEAFNALTPYRVMRVLYARYDSVEEVIAACRDACCFEAGSVTDLQVQHFLYSHAVLIRPAYRHLLFDPAERVVRRLQVV